MDRVVVKKWGDFKRLRQCADCGRLQKPFCSDFPEVICPDCGSGHVKVVAARWEESFRNEGGVFGFRLRVLHRSEVRGVCMIGGSLMELSDKAVEELKSIEDEAVSFIESLPLMVRNTVFFKDGCQLVKRIKAFNESLGVHNGSKK